MLKIKFINFNIDKGRIDFDVITYDENNIYKEDKLFFELSEPIIVSDNLILIALSTLCGKEYDEIYLDLDTNLELINQIQKFTDAKVTVKNVTCDKLIFNKCNDKILLNFSGGFDSLAALCVLPKDKTEIVSINFGGWFESENDFFKKFNPYTVSTNFRQLKYDRASWTFMGIAGILFSDFLNAKYNVFGTILEGTPYHFSNNMINYVPSVQPFSFLNLSDIKFIPGITEVGTAMILCYYKPELVNDSLISLAKPWSEKRYRKQLLTQIVCNRFNYSIFLDLTDAPNYQVDFGTNFALDFLALYQLKFAGLNEVEKTLSNIPQEAIDLVNNLSLEFYEKYNTNFLKNIPKQFQSEFLKNLAMAGVLPYNEIDFDEFIKVREFLSKFHKNLDTILH